MRHQDQLNPDAMRSDTSKMSEAEIDYELMETFPASDPPSWTLGIARREQLAEKYEGEHPAADKPSHQNEITPSA